MPWLTGMFNLAMLLGLAYLGYKLLWVPAFAVTNAVLTEVPRVLSEHAAAASGPQRATAKTPAPGRVVLWPLVAAYLLWGYLLARVTAAGTQAVQQALPLPGAAYPALASALLALFVVADRIGMLWYAERRGHAGLLAAYRRLGLLVAGMGSYGLLHLWLWPGFGGTGWIFPVLGWLQRLLAIPGAGIALGVVGLFYLFRLSWRIYFFIRRKGKPWQSARKA
ncbi:MAG: hypothetical protein AB1439_07050 [candidate division FCPU426 bacterium]